ncbi:hypothetical protein AVEN_33529-1 [Araneus ventricosus]|uniref:Uncharacterized protein n=1 Tax=Araneus ventricosus TaxID=182803 RepID=A0A4Y2L730_ARAVE|nr:hypothetical protein AVEN_33529-1 [Araneus ventricosus]
MITEELHLTQTTIHQILSNELGMRRICAKMFPKNLSLEQKVNRRNTCLDFLERTEKDPLFWSVSLLVTRIGYFSTTPKRNARDRNGTLQAHPGKKSKDERVEDENHAELLF